MHACLCEKILEYKFGTNFGQIFYDYSGKDMHAINGDYLNPDDYDTKPTDRGAFFSPDSENLITLPPNDIAPTNFILPSSFSIVFWILVGDSHDHSIFNRIMLDNTSYINIKRQALEKKIWINLQYNNISRDSSYSNSNAFPSGRWQLFIFTMNIREANAYINHSLKLKFTIDIDYSEKNLNFKNSLGSKNLNTTSMEGYIWYFAIFDNIETSINFYGENYKPNNCNSEICPSQCDPDFIQDTELLCNLTNFDFNKYGSTQPCSENCKYGCTTSLCLDCTCNSQSCFIRDSEIICLCQKLENKESGDLNFLDDCCFEECSTCYQKLTCLTCKSKNATPLSINGCKCNDGYYRYDNLLLINEDSCRPCHPECQTCFGPSNDECFNCVHANLEGVCVEDCPLGFVKSSKTCKDNKKSSPSIKFTFTNIGDYYLDSQSSLKAYNVTETMPTPTYLRGAYFSGDSALKIQLINQMMLSHIFTFSLWINPYSISAWIFDKYLNTTMQFQLFINDSIPTVQINSNKTYKIQSSTKIKNNYWNHIFISVNHTQMSLIINYKTTDQVLFSKSIFIDSLNSEFFIGCTYSLKNMFIGFIYLIETYTYIPNINLLVIDDCSSCNLCPATKKCIPLCFSYEYWDISSSKCKDCPNACPINCKSADTCNLCADFACIKCSSFDDMSCIECSEGYEVNNTVCEKCDKGEYYENVSKKCEKCPVECLSCKSTRICSECIENSSLSYNKCICNEGYNLTSKCERNIFKASLSITQDNIITLFFSEDLSKTLEFSNLLLSIDEKAYSFQLEKLSSYSYKLTPELPNFLTKNSILKIKFTSNIISISNSLLSSDILSIQLFLTEEIKTKFKEEKIAKEAKSTAKLGITISLSITLGLTFLTFDPSSLFNFLNSAEMFYMTILFQQDINSVLLNFLLSLRTPDLLPSIYDQTVDKSKGAKMPLKLQDFGFESNLCILNAGTHLTAITLILIIFAFVKLFSYFKCLKTIMMKLNEFFRYKVFLRFWLQTYFELLIIGTFGIRYNNWENSIQIIDGTICIIILVISIKAVQFLGFLTFIYVLIKQLSNISDNEIMHLESRFGTFFEEFHLVGNWNRFFYILYIIRRSLLVLTFHFYPDKGLQPIISIVFSLIISFYAIFFKCFKSKAMNYYHFINELILAAFYAVFLIDVLLENNEMSEENVNICIKLAMSAWALNIFFSVITNFNIIFHKIKRYIMKKRTRKVVEEYVTSENNLKSKDKEAKSE
ncbi:hypothetical protein SteCoe_17909 [Stentor coeruleus]|uniref:TNFR-Cys domain-containing protein n=1 Tax=Stentor coeruleus TaxID=5963 RepID=A0A1R2BXW2_9CILI|nr:hypothetical protein SteCoe_17909 [Stentor coeruleus]